MTAVRQAGEHGQWWRWPSPGPRRAADVTVTALVSWARPCHGFRVLRDAGGGRLMDHTRDAVMLPLLAPGPGLDVRNRRCGISRQRVSQGLLAHVSVHRLVHRHWHCSATFFWASVAACRPPPQWSYRHASTAFC